MIHRISAILVQVQVQVPLPYNQVQVQVRKLEFKQESCAIAKMTAQCALHMGALKIFETP